MANSRPAKGKLKTHKAAAARLTVTGSGKLLRSFGTRGKRRKKRLEIKSLIGEMVPMTPGTEKRARRLIPYGTD